MKEFTIDQVAKVLAMYVGQKFTGHYQDGREVTHIQSTIEHSNIEGLADRIVNNRGKLLLKPVSEISLENAVVVAEICHACYNPDRNYHIRYKKGESIASPKRFAQLYYSMPNGLREPSEQILINFSDEREMISPCVGVSYFSSMSESFQYLIENGYAVPLRIIGNKTPIDAGLAIDASTLTPKP